MEAFSKQLFKYELLDDELSTISASTYKDQTLLEVVDPIQDKLLQDPKNLKCQHANLYTITNLLGFENVEKVNLSHNYLQQVIALKFSYNLISLFLDYNQIQQLDYLDQCNKLKTVSIRNNDIQSSQVVQNLKQIQELDISGNNLKECEYIGQLSNLKKLVVRNNKSILNGINLLYLQNLEYLDLTGTQVQSFIFLYSLKNLKILKVKNTQFNASDLEYCKNYIQNIETELNAQYTINQCPHLQIINRREVFPGERNQ